MGIILGALGGAGEALQKIGEAHMKAGLEQETYAANAKVGSDLTLAREQALEQFKQTLATTTANQQRDAQVARIGAAKQGIVSGKLADKYATSDAAVAAAQGGASPEVSAAPGNEDVQAALTPEQLGVINQAKARDTSALMGDQDVLTQAAIQTGDIAPKDAMVNSSKLEVAQIRAQAAQDIQNQKTNSFMEKLAYMNDKADKDRASRELLATMRAIGSGKGDSETAKIKTANTYLETVNTERKATGQDPMTFEDAYQIANYAPKPNQDDSIRARVVLNLVANNPKLAEKPAAFKDAVDSMMASIKDEAPPAPAPKPGASAPKARPPLTQFLK